MNENLHVQGYLAYWDELLRRHPGMLIDSCASGGRRNDLETMRRAVPLVAQRLSRQPRNCGGQSGAYLRALVLDSVLWFRREDDRQVHVPKLLYAQPDGQCGRARPGRLAGGGRIYDDCRKVAPYMLGDYYPVTPYSLDNSLWIAWQFDSPEKGEGVVQAFRQAQSPYESIRVKLRGLNPDAVYALTNFDVAGTTEMSGLELLEKGISVVMKDQPGSTVIVYKKKQ